MPAYGNLKRARALSARCLVLWALVILVLACTAGPAQGSVPPSKLGESVLRELRGRFKARYGRESPCVGIPIEDLPVGEHPEAKAACEGGLSVVIDKQTIIIPKASEQMMIISAGGDFGGLVGVKGPGWRFSRRKWMDKAGGYFIAPLKVHRSDLVHKGLVAGGLSPEEAASTVARARTGLLELKDEDLFKTIFRADGEELVASGNVAEMVRAALAIESRCVTQDVRRPIRRFRSGPWTAYVVRLAGGIYYTLHLFGRDGKFAFSLFFDFEQEFGDEAKRLAFIRILASRMKPFETGNDEEEEASASPDDTSSPASATPSHASPPSPRPSCAEIPGTGDSFPSPDQ